MNDYERIQNAVQFIEEHLQNDLNITDIAAKSCFSPFHFQRLFQAISGFSVYQYIRNRRLSEAALLLEKTDRSILTLQSISAMAHKKLSAGLSHSTSASLRPSIAKRRSSLIFNLKLISSNIKKG